MSNTVSNDQEPQASFKRRAAVAVLGEKNARGAVRTLMRARAKWRNVATADGRASVAYLTGLKGTKAGQTCVIIGNGPSLKETNLELLRGVDTFGLNRIYLMFKELGFTTTYHVVVNQLVVEQCAEDFKRIEAPLFTTMPSREYLAGADGIRFLNKLAGPYFSRDVTQGIWEGATVTFVAMQLAYYMGYSRVILVGVDHKFAQSGPAHKVVVSEGPDASHFDPNYFGKGFRWQLPDLETSEIAYALARDAFAADGREIVDATVGGHLQVYPKAELAEAIQR